MCKPCPAITVNHVLHRTMIIEITSLILSCVITGAISLIFFFEDSMFVRYLAVFVFFWHSFILITAIFTPIKGLAAKGFMWRYYILNIVQIIILLNTRFWFLAIVFGTTLVVILVKNLIALRLYRDNKIYLTRR